MSASMRYIIIVAALITASCVGSARGGDAVAAETAAMQQSLEDKASALVNAPSGVFDVEIVDGAIVRLKIKGEADVPTSMRGSRADRFAREKANRDARAAFTKFLGENVIFSESEAEGMMIQEKNGEESSDVLNASARLYSSNAAAVLKGLIVLMDRIEGEGDRRTCTVVLGWSKKLLDASNTARADMERRKDPVQETAAKPAESNQVQETAKKVTGNVETVTRVGNLDNF